MSIAAIEVPVESVVLDRLGDPQPFDARGIVLVVAHPDDETIGMGGQLHRMRGVCWMHMTDGAPRKAEAARRHGFETAADYAAARRAELAEAAAIAGVAAADRLSFGLVDQEVSFALADLARALARRFAERGSTAVFTHPYEGGHPDHDATAFAVHAAAALMGEAAPAIFEMTFYHARPDGFAVQDFAPVPQAPSIALDLSGESLAIRHRMVAAHATQAAMLSQFGRPIERFRRGPSYDFTALPNGGLLHYANYDWGMNGERWLELTGAALADLAIGPVL